MDHANNSYSGLINVKSKRAILESLGQVDCDKEFDDTSLSVKLRNSVLSAIENNQDNNPALKNFNKKKASDIIDNSDIQTEDIKEKDVILEIEKDLNTCNVKDLTTQELNTDFENGKVSETLCSTAQVSKDNKEMSSLDRRPKLKECQSSESAMPSRQAAVKHSSNEKVGENYIVNKESGCHMQHGHMLQRQDRVGVEPKYGWEGVELKAHRVVVASRCEWFRRALLSGMREAIDRCIVVHGCSVATFQLLLTFLYAGHIECSSLPPDQLVDLLVLADHYGVDALKLLVEAGIEQHVDDDSVVPLLTVAHHCNAAHLKEVCVRHCVVSDLVLESDALGQLPEDLRSHLTLAMGKHRKLCSDAIGDEALVGGDGAGGADSPVSVCSTDPLIDDQISLIPGFQYGFGSGQNMEGGGGRLEAVVQQLREVVGQHVPRASLVQITLAADYDLNRALNFFYSSSS
ncbi:hypothetical protein SK128_003274 [Halocaridina rubra]|uniref:BTB domain-containing protein n=1 Tax=Halocaridina rubra TaxID=373956 RepID=A0AAN8ZSC6_HALRR